MNNFLKLKLTSTQKLCAWKPITCFYQVKGCTVQSSWPFLPSCLKAIGFSQILNNGSTDRHELLERQSTYSILSLKQGNKNMEYINKNDLNTTRWLPFGFGVRYIELYIHLQYILYHRQVRSKFPILGTLGMRWKYTIQSWTPVLYHF